MGKEANAQQLVKIHAGRVIIRDGRNEYNDSLSNFNADNGAPMPDLPAEYIGESYIPNMWHRVTTGSKEIQREMPWAQGEALLGKLDALLAAQESRISLPTPDPDPGVNARRLLALEGLLARRARDADATQDEKDYQDTKRGTP
jgi:hypothetical protein